MDICASLELTPAQVQALKASRLLLTRPQERASAWLQAAQALQMQVANVPLLALEQIPEDAQARHLWLNLDLFQHIICVSPTAAHALVQALDTYWPQPPLGIDWYTVGTGSAQILQAYGLAPVICPQVAQGDTSEALLALPELSTARLAQSRCLICRGEGGRMLLRDTLQARGASVTLLNVYRRRAPNLNTEQAHLLCQAPWDAVVVTSGEALKYFTTYLATSPQSQRWLTPLLVPSARLMQEAQSLGFRSVVNTQGATLTPVLRALASLKTN